MKKAMLIFLAAAMLVPLLVSCSEKPKTPAAVGTSDGTPGTEPVTEDKGLVSVDSVPALDFDGESFDILQYTQKNWFYVEDQNGEQLNDIVYERNRTLEERFNITIEEPNTVDWDDLITMVATLVPAGDDTYDMVSQSLRRTEHTLSKGVLRNVLDLPYIDIDNPWYTQGLEDAVIKGKLLFRRATIRSATRRAPSWCISIKRSGTTTSTRKMNCTRSSGTANGRSTA